VVESKEARYSDMDVNGHLNHLALEALHEDARAGINEQYVPGTYEPTTHTFGY
jgi:acyl-CoA thioester hydrolase